VTLALSILANQVSAVSLVGAPAFVALREGGGLRWLQYELALPLAMLLLVAALVPALRSVPGSSIYAYAEARFGRDARRALAGAFLLSRGLSLGVILYATSLVVAEANGVPAGTALVAVGLLSVLYTDVVQLVLLWVGTFVCAVYVLVHGGASVLAAIPGDRTRALVLDATGLGDGATFAFWPMLLGGLFLYLSYYGCDQSQAQRLLTARDEAAARDSLVLNGLLRFPLVATFCGFGLLLAGLLQVDPAFAALMRDRPADSLVPVFMVSYLPPGLRGLLLAAILAAAMSSIDSAPTRWARPSTGPCWLCSCRARSSPVSASVTRSSGSRSVSASTWRSHASRRPSRGSGGTLRASSRRRSRLSRSWGGRSSARGSCSRAARRSCSAVPSS
jgi:SSS family solute:Na+ symporter